MTTKTTTTKATTPTERKQDNMSDREVLPQILSSLVTSRPRPSRNHKPSTPSALSPTYASLPSLFDDDQLTAFFCAGKTVLPDETSSTLSDLESNGSGTTNNLKESREEEEKREVDDGGRENEAKKNEVKEGDEGAMRENDHREGGKERAELRMEEEEVGKGCEDCGEKEEEGDHNEVGKKMEEKDEKEEGDNDARRKEEEDSVARFPLGDGEGEVFCALDDAACVDAPISQPVVTQTCVDSPLSPLLAPCTSQPAEAPHDPSSNRYACTTPDSSITDDAAQTENLSSPQLAAHEDDDLIHRYVFPPNISRLGNIYNHLHLTFSSEDSSCSDSESEIFEILPKKVSLSTESQNYSKSGDGLDQKRAGSTEFDEGEEGTDGAALVAARNSQSSNRSSSSSLKSFGQAKKVPPAKPLRLRTSARIKNNDAKRRSREDPVRYKQDSNQAILRAKRSASMINILESNLEVSNEKGSRDFWSLEEEEEMTGLLQSPTETQIEKKDSRQRAGNFRYRDAAKIVSSIMSKKSPLAPFLHRKENSMPKNFLPRKPRLCKDKETSLSSSSAPSEDHRQDDVAPQASQPPHKPPRKTLDALETVSLDKAQTTCTTHGALLNFYCIKCRMVVCRDCMVVAHSQGENHKVLDTMESLAMLRLEGVLMLRHYTILDTMHTSLTDIYRRFMLQYRDANIAAIGRRLDEGKYLGEVVKEAEQVVTWMNLYKIQQCVKQWEVRKDEWSDLVFLASRCTRLTDMNFLYDTVLLRMGNWVMPTPWIQLSHLLQPYLRTSKASQTSSPSFHSKDNELMSSGHKKALDIPSQLQEPRKQSGSPYNRGTITGGTDQPFPYNARQMVLSNLIPYIILNPDIRYFVHVGGSRDVNLTLVVVPVDDHAHDCLKRGCNNAIQSSDVLRQAKYSSSIDAITLVEQQMTCGSCRTRINASSMSLGPSSAPAVVKVSFSDVTIVSDGQGLPPVKDGVKRGDMIVDQSSHGRPTLTVIMKDIKDFPALRLGQVTWGMDSLTCLVNTEDTKRGEFSRSSGFRAKIKATVMREEEAVYDVMFGMDL